MAPPRKSRSSYKRSSNLNEVSPEKDAGSSKSGKYGKKKKLTDMLGPQWSHVELELFYDSFRKHGKDWKKVAAALTSRSVGMVEALFSINRAYLSLPEGMVSVAGLKAMMIDHYNVLEGSESDQDSIGAIETRKLQKRKMKVQHAVPKELSHSNDDLSNDVCLSLLKRRRIDGGQQRAVGKRTPRFPVSSLHKRDARENYVSLNRWGRKSEVRANDDDVAHEAVLELATAHKGGSPQVSRSPFSRSKPMKPSPGSWERLNSRSSAKKHGDVSIDDKAPECSTGSRGTEAGELARSTTSLLDMEGIGTVEVRSKGKKIYMKKEKTEDKEVTELEDGGEACSGTEERGCVRRKVVGGKVEQYVLQGKKKRSKKLYFGDETVALDALQTLADLSLIESESSVQLKEESRTLGNDVEANVHEDTSMDHQKDFLGEKKKLNFPSYGFETSKLKPGRVVKSTAISHVDEIPKHINKIWRRKSKPAVSKSPNSEFRSGSHLDVQLNMKSEADGGESNKPLKGKRTNQTSTAPKQWKLLKPQESSNDADQKGRETDSFGSLIQPVPSKVNLLNKHTSIRKRTSQITWGPKDSNGFNIAIRSHKQVIPMQEKPLNLKDKLSCWLSSDLARKWCKYEWFYSAIDYPWFEKREFKEYLNHVGLGEIPRLTKIEWSVIRSSLGKPRRFSEKFLSKERKKLEQYREAVRKHYTDVRTGAQEGLPADLARPLTVGQRVIAIHPKTREIHGGSILTTDHDRCRIQFDRPDIGVEFVKDVDCMPMNPLDNMPDSLRRQSPFANKFTCVPKEPPMNGNMNTSFGGAVVYNPSTHPSEISMSTLKQGKDLKQVNLQIKGAAVNATGVPKLAYIQSGQAGHFQAREADIQAVSNLTRSLDKQEALLMELRKLNNDVLQQQIDEEVSLKDSDSFKNHYATVLVQLKEAGSQSSSALLHLRERNTYQRSTLPPWMKPPHSSIPVRLPSSDDKSLFSQESECDVLEIVNDSRLKAQALVDTAIKAISTVKEGEDAFTRIGEAFDSMSIIQQESLATASPDKVATLQQQNKGTSEPDNNAPSAALITSCVATLLMIQTCTERHYPPADAARILDSAVSSLRPYCSENLSLYREIQTSMGRLRTHILALVPS